MPRRQKDYHYIYKTTNLVNGKYYIGMHSTDNLKDGYIGSGKRLWYSINKYGKKNFKCEILEFLPDRISLKEREKKLVNEDILKDKMCMNLQPGGGGGFINEEHRNNFLSQSKINSLKGVKKIAELRSTNEEWVKNVSLILSRAAKGNKAWLGKKHTEETKLKIGTLNSLKQKGESNSQYGTCWITNGTENKKIKKGFNIPNDWYLGRTLINNN